MRACNENSMSMNILRELRESGKSYFILFLDKVPPNHHSSWIKNFIFYSGHKVIHYISSVILSSHFVIFIVSKTKPQKFANTANPSPSSISPFSHYKSIVKFPKTICFITSLPKLTTNRGKITLHQYPKITQRTS